MRIDDENKVEELLEIYKDDVAELKSKRGTGFPIIEARQDTEIAYKEMFIKDLERAINSKSKLKKYYWRKRKKYLAWFEDERNLYLNKSPNGSVRLANTKDFDNWKVKFTEQEARNLLKNDFYMFEHVEVN